MEETIGVVGLVKDNLRDFILDHWKMVEDKFASKGVQSFSHPNLSFQGGIINDIDSLEDSLSQLCSRIAPFEIIVDGFGFFEEPSKVAFLKVIKTEDLIKVHTEINEVLERNCQKVFDLYKPENWVPHITIAMEDITGENFQQLKKALKDQHPRYRQIISEIQLIKLINPGYWKIVRSWKCVGTNS